MANRIAMMPAGRMISWSELASIGVRRSSTKGLGPVRSQRVACATRERATFGSVGSGSLRYPNRGGTLQAVAECNKAREAGSNPLVVHVMHLPDGRRR